MVPPSSHRVSRVRRYSGYSWPLCPFAYVTLTLFRWPSHAILLELCIPCAVQNPKGIATSGLASSAFARHYYRALSKTPKVLLPLVWPLPRSLATTRGISVDFSSSPYLDVSVQAVPLPHLWIQYGIHRLAPVWIAPFGNLRISAHLRLPAAYRSLSRPSSAPSAKAFPLRSL